MTRRILSIGLAALMFVSAAWATTRFVGGSSAEAAGGQESQSQVEPVGEPTTIASGQDSGRRWVLRGFRARVTTDGAATDAICLSLTEAIEQSPQCFSDAEAAVAESGLVVEQRPAGQGVVFGEVSSAAAAVAVRYEDGTRDEAVLVPAPRGLDVDVKFFVYSMALSGDMTLIAEDANGDVLAQKVLAHHPVLSVQKTGGASGTVTSYHTDLLQADSDRAQAPWIDCGNLCVATLAGARVTLRATPSPGAVFSGWSGACSGTGECVLTVDADRQVIARFESGS